jgi:hypothetical protein
MNLKGEQRVRTTMKIYWVRKDVKMIFFEEKKNNTYRVVQVKS